MDSKSKLLTPKEVADFFGVSIVTLIAWRKKGIIDAIKIKRKVFFTQEEIDRVLKENRQHFRRPRRKYF